MGCSAYLRTFLFSFALSAFLVALMIATHGIALAQSGSDSVETNIFDRPWRKTSVDIEYLRLLASDYSFDAATIRTRVMNYLDKAKGNVIAPPYAISTMGYQPETAAYHYLDEARDWPGMCARLRVILAACDAELGVNERRAKWQYSAMLWYEEENSTAQTPAARSYVARRVILYLSRLFNAGNYTNDRHFATHSSSWLIHLIRRGWLSELLASLEPPTERFSSDDVLSITNEAALDAQKLGGLANSECAIQLLKVLAPRFIRPGEFRDSDNVHYNLSVINLALGRYDQARAEAELLRPDGNLAPCRKYFDKLITETKAKKEAADKAAKRKYRAKTSLPSPAHDQKAYYNIFDEFRNGCRLVDRLLSC